MEPLDDAGREQVDGALEVWRQGDCVLGEHWFLFRTDADRPLTADGVVAAAAEVDAAECEVLGFVLITQTCDIVRRCSDRPFVEICPLVKVDEPACREVERGRRPNYAFIPGLADQFLVADLERVMTVEKSVVAAWDRVEGCQSDGNARRLSLALARKRARTAYPDDFVAFASPLVRVPAKDRFKTVEGVVQTLDDLTAREYVESDPLDLDHLTARPR